MATTDKVHRVENLRDAWNWIQSNPSPEYKNYFRALYCNFSLAEEQLLAGLSYRLKRGIYQPAHACKLYVPKRSGGLRPISLLTVEDQIVYQAFVNIIAKKFRPRIRKFYGREVFSHILANTSSPFFYEIWQTGYRALNREARMAFDRGFEFSARFDLTACYDSLDHNVLRHLLRKIGCDSEFCDTFTEILSRWTATARSKEPRIYQGHGIPQGPLSSGLVAEVVLNHFDKSRRIGRNVRYLRYVDDTLLLAKTEKEVRSAAYELQLLSKEIGLFPQTAKIKFHKITDIENELKSISRPDDESLQRQRIASDQNRVHRLLTELSPKYQVSNSTRFKFVLAKSIPRHRTNQRLWKILDQHPELYGNILAYFRRYKEHPKRVAEQLVIRLESETIHGVIIADLIRTVSGRLNDSMLIEKVDELVMKHWKIVNVFRLT